MCIFSKSNSSCRRKNRYRATGQDQSGAVLIYIVVVMLVFAFLGAGMVSMFTSSSMMSSGVPNYAREAEHLAEAGMRYAISELRNNGYTKGTISTLNSTTYTLDDAGSFTVNVFGKWFAPVADYNAGSGTLSLSVPQGQFPSSTITTNDFDIPANAWVANLEGYRDALIFSGTPDSFTAEIQNVAYSSINIDLTDDFQAEQDEPICLAVQSDSIQNPGAGGVLNLPYEAKSFFPEKYGSFHVTDTMEVKKLYFYEEMTDQDTFMQLTGLSEAVSVNTNDYIILAPRNHMIAATGASGSSVSGGANFHAANFRQNVDSPQDVKPPAMDLPADVSPTGISDYSSPSVSTSGAVDVSVDGEGNPLITLGGNVSDAFGSVWYGGTSSRGGVNVCDAGVCEFNDGMRAFFIMDYQGTGDGFTFAIINGDKNSTASTGGSGASGELLGYAGDGLDGNGLQPPKMAIEFDTYINPGAYDPSTGSGRNDQGSSDMDHLQFVYWGDTIEDKFDDNVHGFDGMREKWTYTTGGNIRSSPALDSVDDRIYFGSDDDYIYSLDSDGSLNWRFNTGDNVQSSPLISGSYVHIGSNNNRFYLLNRNQTSAGGWLFDLGGDVKSSPAAGAGNHVYVGSDNNSLWDVNNSTLAYSALKSTGHDVRSSPAIDPNDGAIYFGSNDNRIYAINPDGSTKSGSWPVTTGGDVVTRPAIDTTGGSYDGTIYVGSKDGYVYALNPDGSQAWTYNTTGPIESSPAIHKAIPSESDSNDGTIYIGTDAGSFEGYLLALDPDPSAGTRVKWSFKTGDNNVRSSPIFDDGDWNDDGDTDGDKAIWFGSDQVLADEYNFYALSPSGVELGSIYLGNRVVKTKPAIGSDGMVYVGADTNKVHAITPHCSLENIEDITTAGNAITSATLDPADISVSGDPNNWLNEGRYWAVRMEALRGTTANTRGKYEYTLKAWIRQCATSTCSNILDTYFADTRIEYTAKTAHLEQTVELCSADQTKFETALIGFTEASGSSTQNVIIQKLEIGLIRPGDDVITSDPNWP